MHLKEIVEKAHGNAKNKGFYDNEHSIIRKLQDGEKLTSDEIKAIQTAFNVQKIALIITEATEAIEELRKGRVENHKEEIADIVIRVADYSGGNNIDLQNEVIEKMQMNEKRKYKHGKLF